MRRTSADMVVRAGEVEELGNELRRRGFCACFSNGTLGKRMLERAPALVVMLARQRVLNVAQTWACRRTWISLLESSTGFAAVGVQGFQPSFGFFFKIVERCRRGDLTRHRNLPSVKCPTSAYFRLEEGS